MTSTPTLAGKRALVTGGSRGIGAAIVRRLASQGATEP
jgi:3-oxoacyl-[acyl-carrier protein] reductase